MNTDRSINFFDQNFQKKEVEIKEVAKNILKESNDLIDHYAKKYFTSLRKEKRYLLTLSNIGTIINKMIIESDGESDFDLCRNYILDIQGEIKRVLE